MIAKYQAEQQGKLAPYSEQSSIQARVIQLIKLMVAVLNKDGGRGDGVLTSPQIGSNVISAWIHAYV